MGRRKGVSSKAAASKNNKKTAENVGVFANSDEGKLKDDPGGRLPRMMEGVKTLPSPAPVNISSKQQLVQTKSIEQCSENLRNSLNNNNSPSSGIGKSDVSSSVTNSSDLKYLHKKFKRIASATVDDLPTPRSQRDSDRSGVGLSERCPPSINGDDRISSPKITNSTDIHVQRQEILPNKIPIVQIHQPQVHQNSVSFQPSVPGGAACTDQNPPSSGRNVCQYCNLNCTKPSVLQKHIRSHTNERPYPCTPCGFAFKTKSNLYKHCRSRAHTLRLQGVDAPPQDDDLSDQDQDNDLSSNASGSDVVSRTASPMDDRVVSPYQMPEKPYKPKFHNAAAFYTKEESTESSVSGSGSIYQQDNCGPPIASNSTRNFPIAVPSNHQTHQLASQQDLEQHISKIISDNEAIMEDVEPALQKKYHKITGISRGTSIQDGSTSKASTSAGPVKIHRDESHPVSLLAKINSQAMVQPNVVNQQTPSPLLPLQSTSAQPLNLIKIPTPATESSDSLRKRCYSESFGGADLTTVANHPQNPERSIIKGLLLDWKSVTGGDGDDAVHTCQLCKISFRSAENLKYHSICYCQGNHSAPLSPVGTPSHKYSRSNSIHVNLPEKYNPNSLKNLAKYTLRQPPPRNPSTLSKLAQSQLRHPKPKPEKIVLSQSNLIASSSSTSRQPAMCEIQTPLPSPGPLLGKTRLVEDKRSQSGSDEVVITHVNHDLKHMKRGPDPQSNFPDQDAEVKLTAEKRLRLEYANSSQIPLSGIYGNTKAPALSLVGLEYLRNNKHMPQTEGHSGKNREMYGGEISHAKKFDVKMQSEDSIRRDSSGGSIISESPGSDSEQNISIRTPGLYSGGKVEKMATTRDSPPIHPLTPSLLVASTLCAPSLVSSGKSGMNHFQFPPINPITAFNPLTLPPVSVTPEHATTILHGGKLIPFVPGIPGPNTSTPTKVNIKRTSSPNMKKSLSGNPLIFSMSNNAGKKIDHPPLFNGQHQPMSIPSIKIESLEEKNRLREQKFKPMPKMKQPEMKKSFIFARIADNLSPRKPDVADEETHFSFENIPKAEVKVPTQQPVSVEIPSETEKRDEMTEKQRTKFLRPTSLPLKPGTFIPKRHHGITPTTNTLPLISPETPRPSKTCIQMYINGQAYTYLGLKCSTKPFYCTVNKTQPIYLPHHIRTISMYSQWQVCAESNPHPLGLKPDAVISLYDSRHRPMNYTVAQTSKEFREIKSIQSQGTICTPFVITHKDQNQHHALKQLPIPVEKIVDKSPEKDVSGSKNDGVVNSTVPGGYESTEDYEYVKGRGFGRYVCHTCGIRCRKPSMLKKHIRTHTNIRPYTCQYCAFSFKTKGNLTKHMKSKSHAKKCEELGIIPIPMTVSDEVLEMDSNKERQVTVPGDSDSDDDSDGDEPDSELSDADESRSRLQEHEAAKCLLSLSMTNHASESSTDAPSSFCKSPQYPAQASDVQSATQRRVITFNSPPTIFDFPRLEQYYSNPNIHKVLVSTPGASSHFEYDDAGNMPMDLTKPRELTPTKVADVVTTMEPASFLISLVSITDKMPQTPIPAEIDGNKLLQEYLTEKALQGSKMKQCQKNAEVLSNGNVIFISSPVGTPVKDVKNELSGEKTTASIETLAEIAASSKKMDVLGKGFPTRTSNDVAKNVASEYLKMTSKSKVLFPQKADDGAESGTEVADPPTDGNISVNSSKIAGILARTVVVGENGRVTPEYPAGSFSPARRLTRIQEDGRSVCEICSKTFQKPSQLHLHFNIHFLERKYRCEPCAVSFRTQGHLRKHERSDGHNNKVSRTSTFGVPTTTNPRPFKCSDCKVAFRIHGHLAKHLRSKMHVLRLECHGKLPFGTYAEIERAGMSLTDIDTTDCENSLASLKSLAQKLHESDPSKLSQWNTPNNRSSAGSGAEAGDSDTDEGDEGSPDDSLSGNENSTLLGNTIEGVVTEGGGGMKRKVEDLAMPSALGSATETLPTLPEKRLKSASFDT